MRGLKSGFSHFSDEELMLAIRQGEKTAFNVLYQRYSGKLYGYILKLLWYNEVRAQDLLQDLFTKIITQPHLFDTNEWDLASSRPPSLGLRSSPRGWAALDPPAPEAR